MTYPDLGGGQRDGHVLGFFPWSMSVFWPSLSSKGRSVIPRFLCTGFRAGYLTSVTELLAGVVMELGLGIFPELLRSLVFSPSLALGPARACDMSPPGLAGLLAFTALLRGMGLLHWHLLGWPSVATLGSLPFSDPDFVPETVFPLSWGTLVVFGGA